MKSELFYDVILHGTNDEPVNPVASEDFYFIRNKIRPARKDTKLLAQESFDIGATIPTKSIVLPASTKKQIIFIETNADITLEAYGTDKMEISDLHFSVTKDLGTLNFENLTSTIARVNILVLEIEE